MEAVLRPGDRVCLEGDNQKQADLLSRALLRVDPAKVHDLHMVQSGVMLPEHLDLCEHGIAKRLDFAYSGPQSASIATMLFGGGIELGAEHTYPELFARYFVDRVPPRVDIPGDQVHFVVQADKSCFVEPLFTRDPAAITEPQILTAMLAIEGIYAPYGIRRLNHGIGSTLQIDLQGNSSIVTSPVSAAHRTWARTLAAGAVRAGPGCRRGGKLILRARRPLHGWRIWRGAWSQADGSSACGP